MRLAGVETVVAEGFERIHRTDLIGMGVLPLEFKPGTNRNTLQLDGSETYDVEGERRPGADLLLVVHRRNGETVRVPVTCRLDTAEEISVYEAGGLLQRFAQDFLASSAQQFARMESFLSENLRRSGPDAIVVDVAHRFVAHGGNWQPDDLLQRRLDMAALGQVICPHAFVLP